LGKKKIQKRKARQRRKTSESQGIMSSSNSSTITKEGDVIEVKLWDLNSPEREYWADSFIIINETGFPNIVFFQAPFGKVLNALSITLQINKEKLDAFVKTFSSMAERFRRDKVEGQKLEFKVSDFGSLTSDAFHKVFASLARAATDDVVSYIDFYQVEIAASLMNLGPSDINKLVFPAFRVNMTPMVMNHLIQEMAEQVGVTI